MKKIFLIALTFSTLVLSGCSLDTQEVGSSSTQTKTSAEQYSSKSLSVEFPKTYTAQENADMLIVSGGTGKIIIGGFTPSVGHPDLGEKDFPFQSITYSKDPKMESGAIPAALYYQNGDESTKNELLAILKTVKSKI